MITPQLEKDEGGRMKDEVEADRRHFTLHPSAFILPKET